MRTPEPRTVVVGAGIAGASIAYHLARRGAAVTLVDRGRPAGQATSQSFGWINVSHGMPESYHRLRYLAIQEYARLQRELDGALPLDRCGPLVWWRERAETERFVREHAAWGYDIRLVGRDRIAALEPNLIEPPECAAHAATEAAIEPAAATATLIHAARRAGADVRLGAEVTALCTRGRTITGIRTDAGATDAAVVVLAAGTGAAALCAPLEVALPMASSPAWLLRFRAPGRLVRGVISGPELEIRQSADGHLLVAEDYDACAPVAPDAIARRTLALIKHHLRGADTVEVESAGTAMRPIPADGLPVVGFSPRIDGLYLAVMHAGVTLAPAIGRSAATEILDGTRADALEPCRPERFAA
jgi:glycine/D-amino acid oxidase-like deaminating enzyme